MSEVIVHIPENLIYEVDNGKPIYYRGYKDYLNGQKKLEEIMGSSYIQSLIITKLVYFLMSYLSNKYQVLTSEVGLQFDGKKKRAADIAVFEKDQLKGINELNKYLTVVPKIVIEVDTKADFENPSEYVAYFHKKTDELLSNGVEKVIWVFTDSRKIMLAEQNKNWEIQNWDKAIEVIEECTINLEDLIEEI